MGRTVCHYSLLTEIVVHICQSMKMAYLMGILLLEIKHGLYGHKTSMHGNICLEDEDNGKSNESFLRFGRSMRKEFLFAPDYVHLNQGRFGSYPKYVREAYREFQDRAEAEPDLFFLRQVRKELALVRGQLGDLVKCAAEDIVLIPSTTSGVNSVFRSLVFEKGDHILYFSTMNAGMKSIAQFTSDINNGTVSLLQFSLTFPISNDEIIANFEKFLNGNQNDKTPIRIAYIDHISSQPGVVMPIERIIPMLKQRNILVLIDGAQALGQLPININALAPDFYISSGHKWLYVPKGSAMMYVDKKHQGFIHPALISFNYERPSSFQNEFFWTGTIDYSPYLAVTAALEFRRKIGGESAIQTYNHQLALDGGRYLAQQFGTEVLQRDNQIANMVDVRLPIRNPENKLLNENVWTDALLYDFRLYSTIYKHNGHWWTRLSAQIYNDLDDFKSAAVAFNTICNNVNLNFTMSSANVGRINK